jgi:hypothetical protein
LQAFTILAKVEVDIRPSTWVRRFPVEGGLLLLDDFSSRLFAYNDTARHVWDLIEAGRAEEELASAVAQAWQIPVSLAHRDIEAILAQWRVQGLLGTGKIQPASVAPRSDAGADRNGTSLSRSASEWTCTIRRTTISFAVENEFMAAIHAMLAHLETPGACPQARIEIRNGASGETVLFSDGIERVRTRDPGVLGGGLWQTILEHVYPKVEWLALIHGSALARNGSGLALCGPSGSGKSTLTAGLTTARFDYLADDLVALAGPGGTILPWPVPLSLKPGSFEVITPYRPELTGAPSYRTKDMDARLLVPTSTAWDAAAVQLRRLVFPRFIDRATAELECISTFQAAARLLADRVWIGHPITADRVATFLAWLNHTPSYVVTYGTLEDGMRLIEDVA